MRPSATDDDRHAGAWLFSSNSPGLSSGGSRLGQLALEVVFPVPKQPQRIPELLTRAEVARILAACANGKHHLMLEVCYGCGLRVSELCQLRVSNIDGQRHLLRVTQGKGAKDRAVILTDTLLQHLRAYWQQYRPEEWLFPSSLMSGQAVHVMTQ